MHMKLGDISDFINGGAWSDKAYVDEGYKVVKVTNMINGSVKSRNDNFLSEDSYRKYFKHKLYTHDLIIATVGSHPSQQGSVVGRTSIVPEDYNYALLNQNAVCIRITDERISQGFFNYLTKTIVFKYHIESRAQGSANQVRMALSELKKFSFNYPPLKTQQKIASLLSNYDKLIENNTQRIKLLESMAEELYKEWFVRLRFPGYEDVEVLDGVPKGWERTILDKVCIVSGGGTPSTSKKEYWDNGDILWFSPTDLSKVNSICVFESSKKTNSLGIENSSAKILNSNSFMMTSRATIGLFALIKNDFSTNQGFINITPLKTEEKYYLFYNLKTRVSELKSIATGATFPELSKSQFKVLKILMPTNNMIKLFHTFTNPIVDEIFILEQKTKTLKQTKNLLLPRLMSGKLNVEDLDII